MSDKKIKLNGIEFEEWELDLWDEVLNGEDGDNIILYGGPEVERVAEKAGEVIKIANMDNKRGR